MHFDELYVEGVGGLESPLRWSRAEHGGVLSVTGPLAFVLSDVLLTLVYPATLSEPKRMLRLSLGAREGRWSAVARFGDRRFRIRRGVEASSVVLDGEEAETGRWFVAGQGAQEVEERLRRVLALPRPDQAEALLFHWPYVRAKAAQRVGAIRMAEDAGDAAAEVLPSAAEVGDLAALQVKSWTRTAWLRRVEMDRQSVASWKARQAAILDTSGALGKAEHVVLKLGHVRALGPEEETLLTHGPAELKKLRERVAKKERDAQEDGFAAGTADAGDAEPQVAGPVYRPWYVDPFLLGGAGFAVVLFGLSLVEGLRVLAMANVALLGIATLGVFRGTARQVEAERRMRREVQRRGEVEQMRSRLAELEAALDALALEMRGLSVAEWNALVHEKATAQELIERYAHARRQSVSDPRWQALQMEVDAAMGVVEESEAGLQGAPPLDRRGEERLAAIGAQHGPRFIGSTWRSLRGWETPEQELVALLEAGLGAVEAPVRQRVGKYLAKAWARWRGLEAAEVVLEPQRILLDGEGTDTWKTEDDRWPMLLHALRIACIASRGTPVGDSLPWLVRCDVPGQYAPDQEAAVLSLEQSLAERIQVLRLVVQP